jgi:hypothetical protein
MLYVIDGTGAENDDIYFRDMDHGFMRMVQVLFGAKYYRGPTIFDWSISSTGIINRVVSDINKDPKLGKEDLFLAGHSRGGFVALAVAASLPKGIQVKSVFLFDAVERSLNFGGFDRLAPNISRAYYAKRNYRLSDLFNIELERARAQFQACQLRSYPMMPAAMDDDAYDDYPPNGRCVKEFNDTRALREKDLKYKWAVRANYITFPAWFRKKYQDCGNASIGFGNCLADEKDSDRYISRTFMGSHGAMGGAPIVDPKAGSYLISEDKAAVVAVWAWMEPFFAKEGLRILIGNDPETGLRASIRQMA